MSVPFTTEEIEQLSSPSVTRAKFAELHFPSGTHYYHSGVGNRVIDGHEWIGMTSPLYPGVVADISGIRKEVFSESAAATLILSGAVDGYIRTITDSRRDIEGRRASIYWGLFDQETQKLIGSLRPSIRNGLMTSIKWTRTGIDTRIITLTVENSLSSLGFKPGHKWSSAGHRELHPGDGAMDYVGMQIIETLK